MKYINLYISCCLILFLSACSSTKQTTNTGSTTTSKQNKTAKYKVPSHMLEADKVKFARGVDFVASGNDKVNWSLDINLDDSAYFVSAHGIQFASRGIKRIKEVDRSITLETKHSPFTLEANISENFCGKDFRDREVTISMNGNIYKGCGHFLFDEKLAGTWQLSKLGNTSVSGIKFQRGVPTLEFNLEKQQVKIQDGCNKLFSGIYMQGNYVRFYEASKTRRSCADNAFATKYARFMNNKLVQYKITGNTLVFYFNDDSNISFTKK